MGGGWFFLKKTSKEEGKFRRKKILERERQKKRRRRTFLFEVFIFCPLLLIFSLLCARLRRIHTHTNVYTDINNSVS